MRILPLLKHSLLGLLLISCATPSFAAEDEAEQKIEKEQKPSAPVLTEKPPIYAPPKLKPLKPLAPAPQLTLKKKEKENEKEKTKDKPADKQAQAQQPPLRPNLRPVGSAIQLEKISTAHLSPAMLWHLRRAGVPVATTPGAPQQIASYANGEKFYPGVSRLPEQKPFEGRDPPPNAFERYWPLLLEGRQDPNTGFIIWRLP